MPNINALTTNVLVLNNFISKIENRVSSLRDQKTSVEFGINSGDISANTAVWMGGFGAYAKQKYPYNDGYTAKAVGTIIGIDCIPDYGVLFGFAFSVSNANIYEKLNADFKTRILGYHGLLYGSFDLVVDTYFDWLISGTFNNNHSYRPIQLNFQNYAVSAFYHDWQLGGRVAFSKDIYINEILIMTYNTNLLYLYANTPGYAESGSVAALNLQNTTNRNLLNIGSGLEISLLSDNQWLIGTRNIHALITYDFLNAKNVTLANFLVGSNTFSLVDNPARIGIQVGADFAFMIYDCLQLLLSYNYEYRSGYFSDVGEIKFKYLF